MYSEMCFDKCVYTCNHPHNQDREYYHHHPKFPPFIPFCQTPDNHQYVSCNYRLISSALKHTNKFREYMFFYVTSLTPCNVSQFHACCSICKHVPFCCWVMFHLWIYHHVFKHSPGDGYLGCFQFGATMYIAKHIHIRLFCGHMFKLILGNLNGFPKWLYYFILWLMVKN